MNQKVLLVDCDFAGGSIALNLDLRPLKNIFHISDDLANKLKKILEILGD